VKVISNESASARLCLIYGQEAQVRTRIKYIRFDLVQYSYLNLSRLPSPRVLMLRALSWVQSYVLEFT
jgi:hypothetical protein